MAPESLELLIACLLLVGGILGLIFGVIIGLSYGLLPPKDENAAIEASQSGFIAQINKRLAEVEKLVDERFASEVAKREELVQFLADELAKRELLAQRFEDEVAKRKSVEDDLEEERANLQELLTRVPEASAI